MSIETKVCKPVDNIPIDVVYPLAEEYRELEHFIDNCFYGDEIGLCVEDIHGDDISVLVEGAPQISGITKVLAERMETIEQSLNALGYTMQEEPKEIELHVNHLKGGSDERTKVTNDLKDKLKEIGVEYEEK